MGHPRPVLDCLAFRGVTEAPQGHQMNYAEALAMSETRKRKLGNNTHLNVRKDGSFGIRLHSTDVVILHADGRVELDSGGWKTVTTKARINEYTNARVYSEKGVWFAFGVPYEDGITMNPDGTVTGEGEDPKAQQKLRNRARDYAKAYTVALRAGEVPKPTNGDCWACSMQAKDGSRPLGGADHMLSHMSEDEKYFVPSIVTNAIERFGGSQAQKHEIACVWENAPEKSCFGDFVWDQTRKQIGRWVMSELGLVT